MTAAAAAATMPISEKTALTHTLIPSSFLSSMQESSCTFEDIYSAMTSIGAKVNLNGRLDDTIC